ncbi:MATE family efflux transporter [Sinimarinibacterium thermocellulolyticum]|uniref:Multidrug-efflux transporter n=1 Tax=Sinimarinibacterium thermocellulolyticum TaxID=3170016 RepID=A0ABV2A8H5_9GAMM
MFPPTLPALRREARANLRLAAPIIVTQFTFMGMGTADTIMAGRYSAQGLAAVAVGANVWFLAFMVFMGILMACSPIVAQRIGAGRSVGQTGGFVRAALAFAVVLGLIWMLGMRLVAEPVLDVLSLHEPVRGQARDYILAASWSALPLCLTFVARHTAEAHGLTQVALRAGVVGLLVNVLFDWLLMYGRLGFPQMGPEGCAWATVLAAAAMLLTYAFQYRCNGTLRALQLWRLHTPQLRDDVGEILRLGLPIMLIVTAESWMFNIGALMMARFGADTVAAHQIAINFAALSFMVPLSIGFATTVRVGLAAGAGDAAQVRLRGQAGIVLGACFALLSASVMAAMPGVIVGLYTDAEAVTPLAVRFLYYAAVFQIFDCIQATANGALRGVKDTRVPMFITVSAYWIVGLPLAWWLSFRTPTGPFGVWWGFLISLAIAAAGLSLRFALRGSRRAAAP